MNVTALLWLSTLSGGFASTLAAYATLSAIARRIDWTHARGALWTAHLMERTRAWRSAWLWYAAPLVGFGFAAKATWDGGWILALGFIFAGVMCLAPVKTILGARKTAADAEVADLALVCMAQERREETILQTLDEASVTLNHTGVRRSMEDALARFYNGATESETLEHLLAERANSDWALLVWALLERKRGGNSAELRKKLDALMIRRLRLRKRTQPAFEMTRRSLALALILGVALAAYLTLTPASAYYIKSLQGQAVGSLLVSAWLWTTHVWTAQQQTIEAMIE